MPELRLFILGDNLESGLIILCAALLCRVLPGKVKVVVVSCEGSDVAWEVLSTAGGAAVVVTTQ